MSRRFIPSPALAVAFLALLVALSGTVYAATALPAGSVGTLQLKRGAVTGAKVRAKTLGAAQISNFFNARRVRAGSGNPGALTEQTILSFPAIGLRVTTDGTSDTAPLVLVHLSHWTNAVWTDEQNAGQIFSTQGSGPYDLGPPSLGQDQGFVAETLYRENSLGAISAAVTIRCSFDIAGWSSLHPVFCSGVQLRP